MAYATTGLTNAVPAGGLAVRLSRATDTAVTITLAAQGLVAPSSVDIPAGADRADVPITTTAAGTATITASYDGVNAVSRVIVYDDAAPRGVVELTLERATIAVSSTIMGVVRIDLPGAAAGTPVMLAVMPPSLAMVPASVTVPAGAFEASFTLMTGTSTGAGTVVATAPAGSRPASFSVSASIDRPPMAAGDLVITEIHRNPSLAMNEQNNEWFEVFNPTADGIEINGLQVRDNNGMRILSAPGVAIPSGGYGVIAYNLAPASNGGVDALAAYGGTSPDILLANGDDELHLTYQGTEIDVVDWGSGWPGSSGANGISMCLHFPYAEDNNVASAWRLSVGGFGTGGDTGSPGVASNATNCP